MMGIIDFICRRKDKQIHSLHPQAHLTYRALLAQWLLGAVIEEYNPTTRKWESNHEPTFDPDIKYRLKIQPSSGPLHFETAHQFERGQIWQANNRNRYLVLANTSTMYFPESHNNPDYGEVIVIRYEGGKEEVVTTHDCFGNRRDGNKDFKLVRCLGNNCALDTFANYRHDYKDEITIYLRKDNSAIRLHERTGQVKFD